MITGTSESKQPSAGYVDVPKYIGVGTIKIMAINPNNDKLRAFGWTIPEGAEEPKYVVTTTLDDGTVRQSARVRFMVQIQEPEDKPIIAMDYWIKPEPWMNKEHSKCQVIDCYGRTAWGTKEEIKANKIPEYASGPAKISLPYELSHQGQEKLVKFLMKYLCCTPFEVMDNKTNTWKPSKDPGKLTIDDWKALCAGNARELVSYVATQPDNQLKVIFGVQKTDDNRVFQTFVDEIYLANNSSMTNGIYNSAEKAINKIMNDGYHDNCEFSAAPVTEYTVTPTEVKPAEFGSASLADSTNASAASDSDLDSLFEEGSASDDDMPFGI